MTSENQRVHERLYDDIWNGANADTVDGLVHDECVIHDRDLAEEQVEPELYRTLASATRDIFPDATFTIEDSIAADGKVTVRWTMTGTQEGPVFDVEPTSEQVELTAIEINRFEGSQLVETSNGW